MTKVLAFNYVTRFQKFLPNRSLEIYIYVFIFITRMHSNRMRTVRCSGYLSCHACPPATHTTSPLSRTPQAPCHAWPCAMHNLPATPPTTHTPCHTRPLPCTPPATHTPCHTRPLPCTPPATHAPPPPGQNDRRL